MGPGSILGTVAGALRGGSTVGKAVVELVADPTQLQKGFATAKAETTAAASSMDKSMATGFSNMGTYAKAGVAIAGAAIVAGLAKAVSAASDLNEAVNVANVTFRESAGSVLAFTSNAERIGIAQADALQAASAFGNMAQGMGVARAESAQMSTSMVQLAADMGSFFNVDPTEMLERIRSGLSGEIEPLRRFGVSLDEASVQAYALNAGIVEQGQVMTQAQKFTARYGLLIEKTKNAQGDFARTLGESLPNQARALRGDLTNLAASIGTDLLPLVTEGIQIFRGLIGILGPVLGVVAELIPYVLHFAVAFGALKVIQTVTGWVRAFALENTATTATIVSANAAAAQGATANLAYGTSFRTLAQDAALATTNISRFAVGSAGAATTQAMGATRQLALPAAGRTTAASAVGMDVGKVQAAANATSAAWTRASVVAQQSWSRAGTFITSTMAGVSNAAKGMGAAISGFLRSGMVQATVVIAAVITLTKSLFSEVLADADSVAAGFKDTFGADLSGDLARSFEVQFDTAWQSGIFKVIGGAGEGAIEMSKQAMTIVGEEGAKAMEQGLSSAKVKEIIEEKQGEITQAAGGFSGGLDAVRQATQDALSLAVTQQAKALDAMNAHTTEEIAKLNRNTAAGLEDFATLGGQSAEAFTRDFISEMRTADDPGQVMQEWVQKSREALAEWQSNTAESINFVAGSIEDLAGRTNAGMDTWIQSFRRSRDEMHEFSADLITIGRRGGDAGQALGQQLLGMGEAGVSAANMIANSNGPAFRELIGLYGKANNESESLARKLSDTLIGTLKTMKDVLVDLAKHFITDYEVKTDTTQARKELGDLAGQFRSQGFQIVGAAATGGHPGIRHSGGEIDPGMHTGMEPRADEALIRAQVGEFVVRRQEAKRHRKLLEAINSGEITRVQREGGRTYHVGGRVEPDYDLVPTMPTVLPMIVPRATTNLVSPDYTDEEETPPYHRGGFADLPTYHTGGVITGKLPSGHELEDTVVDHKTILETLKRNRRVQVIAPIETIPGAWQPVIPMGEVPPPWGGFQNGRIPTSAMTQIAPGRYLEPTAAFAYKLSGATGSGMSSAYRSYETQAGLYSQLKGVGPVAPPGASMHGWGKAVDSSGQTWTALHGPGARYNWRSGASFGDPVHHSWGHTGRTGGFVKRDGRIDVHSGEVITNPRSQEGMRAMVDAFSKAMTRSESAMEEAFRRALTDKAVARALASAMREVKVEVRMREETISRSQHRKRLIREG